MGEGPGLLKKTGEYGSGGVMASILYRIGRWGCLPPSQRRGAEVANEDRSRWMGREKEQCHE